MEIFLRRHHPDSRLWVVTLPHGFTGLELKQRCCQQEGLPIADVYLKYNGKLVDEEGELQHGGVYSLEQRLVGGKGGFGSMLRALGAQIEKTTNREACRDLSGRRLRDVNHEKAMAEWIKKQADREAEKEQRRLERLQRKLSEPKHYFSDPQYEQQLDEMSERLEDSVLKGLQASSSAVVSAEGGAVRKRAHPSTNTEAKEGKKKCLWMGTEDLEESGSSDEESTAGSCSSNEATPHSESSLGSASVDNSSVDDMRDSPARPLADLYVPEPASVQRETLNQTEPGASSEAAANISSSQDSHRLLTEEGARESSEDKIVNTQDVNAPKVNEPALKNWMALNSVEELESLGLDRLKSELMTLGLKCGGTLQERAARLFSVKGLTKEKIDPTLFARSVKGKKK
ncbi:replication stress response regulator SDE2 [Carcharodon carcharias]|uniref:replication stress response regulator SDE2 n=1 Tax=Carcharodon carcharias TaxID=13397 RepID=UPI001B7DB451|nr:replication stress response regulator SDE2 [Carcharodon carcharias]